MIETRKLPKWAIVGAVKGSQLRIRNTFPTLDQWLGCSPYTVTHPSCWLDMGFLYKKDPSLRMLEYSIHKLLDMDQLHTGLDWSLV